jgi:uncharacterized protein
MDQMSSFASAGSSAVEPGTAEEVEVDPLRIRPPLHRLDRRFILWRTLNTFFWAVGVIGAFLTLYLIFDSIREWMGPLIWVGSALFAINILFMPTYRYLVHRWETSDRAVYTLTGWVTREWRVIPISRIQSIDTVQGPLERALNLATIRVKTASGQGGVTIEGLNSDIATETVRHLNGITQKTPGDAT